MKTATINYEDYEILLAGAISAVGITESILPNATGEQRAAAEKSIGEIRAAIQRAMSTVSVGYRAMSFQERLSEMIANARANK